MLKNFYKVIAAEQFDFKLINPETPSDWSATYFQFSLEHALRYATDKKSDNNIICLVEFTLINAQVPIHHLKEEVFGDPNVSGSEKAKIAKQILHIDPSDTLMKAVKG